MSTPLSNVVRRFPAVRALVVGDAVVDRFVEGDSSRLSREAPVPLVRIRSQVDVPGGAANTAANAAALGARVELLSVIGPDHEGQALVAALARQGVGASLLVEERGRRTPTLQRVSVGQQLLLRFDSGDDHPLGPVAEAAFCERLRRCFSNFDVIILSDYGKGSFTPAIRATVAELQARRPQLVVLDAKALAPWHGVGPTAVKPNWSEAAPLLGVGVGVGDWPGHDGAGSNGGGDGLEAGGGGRAELVARHGERLLDELGAQLAAVTLDRDGAVVVERGRPPHRTYATPRPDAWAIGAGDTFAATLALALATGADTPDAAELAALAADVVVHEQRTACCSDGQLLARLATGHKQADLETLALVVAGERRRGRRVVYTNGCFDLLHRGHIACLNQAKALGDVLVVGVNGDASVRRLKGPGRPINPLADRVGVLSALSCVDHVVVFDDDTSVAVLAALRPDVYAKGGDYTAVSLPESEPAAALGIELRLLPRLEHRSTQGVIDRIRSAAGTAELVGPGAAPSLPAAVPLGAAGGGRS